MNEEICLQPLFRKVINYCMQSILTSVRAIPRKVFLNSVQRTVFTFGDSLRSIDQRPDRKLD